MKTYLECIPCFVRHALDVGKITGADVKIQEQLMREVLVSLSKIDMSKPPPYTAKHIHSLIKKITNNPDPYKEIKIRHNKLAIKIYPKLKSMVMNSQDPLNTAMRLAMAGNVIDLGVKNNITEQEIENSISQVVSHPIIGDFQLLKKQIKNSKNILYLADNAGEIVFDKIFIEEIGPEKITLAVRGGPIINDATIYDAEFCNLDKIVNVIDNGADAPGTILEECKQEFLNIFWNSDLIIAKGQGNFESLSNVKHNIFFLFKAKCNVIANHANVQVGSYVLTQPLNEDKGD